MANEQLHGVKKRVVSEARQFLVVFLYVWLLLAVFDLYKSLILADENIVQHQGFAVLKALAFAKIMFVAERMGLGEKFKDKPLIWPMLLKSALFAVLLMTFSLLEKAVEDKFWPHAAGRDAINTHFRAIFPAGVVMFAALVPFFGMRELGKVIGAAEMYRLMFVRRTLFVPLQNDARPGVSRSRGKTGD